MNKVGILAPDGKLIPCESYEHLDLADKLVNKMNHTVKNKVEAEDYLQQLGYLIVRARDIYGLIGFFDMNDNLISLTDEQSKWLIENYEYFPQEKRECVDELLERSM